MYFQLALSLDASASGFQENKTHMLLWYLLPNNMNNTNVYKHLLCSNYCFYQNSFMLLNSLFISDKSFRKIRRCYYQM